ncbi:hypothetical protein V144x_34650 [Gimesia aquarii]|uniref:Uncharacterized protein n=1 Tax=Gimesia aquarii TaxID=2527964 RepID=A0A517VYA1_9PLAN|nr:hypothetical protein V144x_34650 [Gimesia aquarii]
MAVDMRLKNEQGNISIENVCHNRFGVLKKAVATDDHRFRISQTVNRDSIYRELFRLFFSLSFFSRGLVSRSFRWH